MDLQVLVGQFFEDGRLGEVVVFFFAAHAAEDGIGILHEEKGGASLPGIWAFARDGKDTMVFGNCKITFHDEVVRVDAAALDEILKKDFVNGHEAAAEEPAFVVAAAGAIGWEAIAQLLP